MGDIVSFENKGQKEKIEEWKQKKGLKSNSAAIRDMINYAYMGLEKERVYGKEGMDIPELFRKLKIDIREDEDDQYQGDKIFENGYFKAMEHDEKLYSKDDLIDFVVDNTEMDEKKASKEVDNTLEFLSTKRVEAMEELERVKKEGNKERFRIPDDTCHICGKQSYSFGEDLNYLAQHIQRAGGRHKEFLKEHELKKEDRRKELNAIERWLTENRCESSKMQELNFH